MCIEHELNEPPQDDRLKKLISDHRTQSLEWLRTNFQQAVGGLREALKMEASSRCVQDDHQRIQDALDETIQDPKFPAIDAKVVRTVLGLALLNHVNSVIQRIHNNLALAGQHSIGNITIEEVTE